MSSNDTWNNMFYGHLKTLTIFSWQKYDVIHNCIHSSKQNKKQLKCKNKRFFTRFESHHAFMQFKSNVNWIRIIQNIYHTFLTLFDNIHQFHSFACQLNVRLSRQVNIEKSFRGKLTWHKTFSNSFVHIPIFDNRLFCISCMFKSWACLVYI